MQQHNILGTAFASPGKRAQHADATDRNIDGRSMLRSFGHPVETCCDMLAASNRTTGQGLAQHCCTNLAKQV